MTSRWLVAATGTAAALPVIASTVRAVRESWVPVGDDAVIATRAVDVFTTHTPLLGQFSASSEVADVPVHSLGPLLYWLLAVPARYAGFDSLPVLMGLVNTGAVLGITWLAQRRGGRPLMFVVAITVALACGSLPAELFSDVWNPSAGLLPFTLVIFLAWSLACGDYRLLPVTVLVASFAMQCHLTYVLPVTAMFVVGVGGLALSGGERRSLLRWAGIAAIVGVVCWTAPVLEQATNSPGKVARVARAALADEPTLGFSAGWHTVVRAIGVPPWWLQGWGGPIERFADVVRQPGAVAPVSAVALLAALALVTARGVRRRTRPLAAAGAIGLVLCAALPFVASATPREGTLFYSIGYTLWWASPAGMWVWGTVSVALLSLLRAHRSLVPERWSALPSAVGLLVAGVVGVVVAASGYSDGRQATYRQVRAITEKLDVRVSADSRVRVDTSTAGEVKGMLGYEVQAAIVYSLRRRGVSPAAPTLAPPLGASYVADGRPYELVIEVAQGDGPPSGAGRVIARVAPKSQDVVTVTLALGRGSPAD